MDEQAQHERQDGEDGQDGQDRQRQILDAAFEEFASQGFRGATIKRIAQRAKLASQALIYWYFPTKEALFQAVLGRHLPIAQVVSDPPGVARAAARGRAAAACAGVFGDG